MIQLTANPETPQRNWIERYFVWICLILFVEVFIFYAATTYFSQIPQFVDLPDLKKVAKTGLNTPVPVERAWLREGKWSWPLGGKILVLPEAFSIPSAALSEGWIDSWWEKYSLRNGQPTTNVVAPAAHLILSAATNDPDRAGILADAIRDYGPLLVKGRNNGAFHVLIGDYASEEETLFLIRSLNSEGEQFSFVAPGWVDHAVAYPHPLTVKWEVETPWTKLRVFDHWGRPLKLHPPEQMRLKVDGVIFASHNTGIYYIRCSDRLAKKVEVELHHDFLMPLGQRTFVSPETE